MSVETFNIIVKIKYNSILLNYKLFLVKSIRKINSPDREAINILSFLKDDEEKYLSFTPVK